MRLWTLVLELPGGCLMCIWGVGGDDVGEHTGLVDCYA
jgi:hypothetical protein